MHYILEGKEIKKTNDTQKWSKFMKSEGRILKQETINGYYISTVFLGVNHNFRDLNDKNPILFETMVFMPDGSGEDEEMDRYYTYDEAMEGHEKFVKIYKEKK